jgi:ribosomal protein L29
LEDELRRLEEENASLRDQVARGSAGGGGGVSLVQAAVVSSSTDLQDEAISELRNEIHSLVDELNTLSAKNDELMAEREQDAAGMSEMEARVEEYRRKYEAVRIELRNLKGGSLEICEEAFS